jgi:hypothetical protein
MMICSENHFAASLRAHVALRRAVTGERFATCQRMHPVFADTENRWPRGETISASPSPETISAIDVPVPAAETISELPIAETITRRGRPRRGSEAETISHRQPWLAAGMSRASWYRQRKSQGLRT